MLDGHVDHISHAEINGWAAEREQPNATVDVSIFVDGYKQAQLGCDLARADLRQRGLWGDGRHGFRFSFPVALERQSVHRISVRFTATGRALTRGDMQLSPDGATAATPERPWEDVEDALRLPMPTTPRETFRLFPFYDRAYGLPDLLARIDCSGRQPSEIRYAVFGGLIADTDQGDDFAATYAPRDHLNELLMSAAFQQELVTLVLNAFPEKRRLLFVHIPKCAGSDLTRHLMTRYPSIRQRWMEQRWASKDTLFGLLRDLIPSVPLFDSIFVSGHTTLDWYLDRRLARPIDRLFTVVRHPIEIAVSQANYVMMRIAQDMERGKVGPDTSDWLDYLGFDGIPHEPIADLADQVCRKTLRTPKITLPNPLCHWLGGGDAATVLDRLAESGAEVTTTGRYNQWLRERWGIESRTRLNESRKFLSHTALHREELDYLNDISAEDAKLFGLVEQRLAGLGTSWLSGSQLRTGRA